MPELASLTVQPAPKGYECRFAVYCPPPHDGHPDMHVIKEVAHLPDGRLEPRLRMVKNYKRPFWITKKGCRTHTQKKEWEQLGRLDRYESTQTDLVYAAAKALQTPWFKGDLRKLSASPYLYGSDILSTAIIKKAYLEKYPELLTKYTLAVLDVETDVLHGTEEIVMTTVSFKDRVFTVVKKSFLEGYANVQARLHEKLNQYLADVVAKRGIQWEVVLVDTEVECVTRAIEKAHAWMPDWLAIWNINFDLPKMLKALERAGLYPSDVFSDPSVPREYRHFKYKMGKNQKVTASGVKKPIKPPEQWHTVYCPSSFYLIDAMCAYRHIRTGGAEEPSYSLDAILNKHLGIRKLKFKEADGMSSIDWHVFMQQNYPLEYVIYNVFDCVSMELLDEETTDLCVTLPLFSGCSDFENFKSQPRRAADNLHFFCLAQPEPRVIGSTGSEMATDLDKLTIGLAGWITTLPAHCVVDNGLQWILEAPVMRTNIRAHVGDLDVSASYPNGECVFNMSKETTKKELVKIVGVSEAKQRALGINLSAGHVNAVEICVGLYGLPTMTTMLDAFIASRQSAPTPEPLPIEVLTD